MFIAYANIFFQIIGILFLFEIGRRLFSAKVGFFAALFFSISYVDNLQSSQAWNVYIMQPVALLGYLFAVLFYQKRKFKFLTLSFLMLVIADGFDHSMLPVIPYFIFLLFLILKRIKTSFRHYLLLFIWVILAIALVDITVFIYLNIFSWRGETMQIGSFSQPYTKSWINATKLTAKEIIRIKQKEGYADLHYFQTLTISNNANQSYHEAILLAPLEKFLTQNSRP